MVSQGKLGDGSIGAVSGGGMSGFGSQTLYPKQEIEGQDFPESPRFLQGKYFQSRREKNQSILVKSFYGRIFFCGLFTSVVVVSMCV